VTEGDDPGVPEHEIERDREEDRDQQLGAESQMPWEREVVREGEDPGDGLPDSPPVASGERQRRGMIGPALGGGLGAEFLGLDPQYALKYLVYFLIVVAVGGLGRVPGVFYAALLIGILDFVLKKYVPSGGTAFIYALTILLLLWRPQGLFGTRGT